MKEIQLTQGKVALVDDADYEYLNQWKWYYNQGYAVRSKTKHNKRMAMHRLILEVTNYPEILVDHINHNGIDNQRRNIRKCNRAENSRNTLHHGKTSKYLGVYFDKYTKRFKAQININGKVTHIGRFDNEDFAGIAYDKKAREYFKEFANPNFK